MADHDPAHTAHRDPTDEPPAESTLALLERARTGDDRAMEALFQRHLGPLQRWAHGRLPSWARDLSDTDDLVQDTLLRTFKHLEGFDPRGVGALQAYLRQALLNRVRDELRRRGRRPELALLDGLEPSDSASPLEDAIGCETLEQYHAALERLRPEERETIVGRVEMGYTYEDLAQVLGKPSADAARKAVQRALVRLAGEMRADRGAGQDGRIGTTAPASSSGTVRHADDAPAPGSTPPAEWGHLRLRERIGRGAFGDVYRAWDSKLDRDVALKLLPEDRSSLQQGKAILEEGRLLARLHHRNVVSIYGADRIDNRVGLWMELIEGETLQQAIAHGRTFSPAEAVRIGIELAGAIGAVHDAGLLHRDVKPHNIMLAREGRLVLMDFGAGHDARSGAPLGVAGTPLYLAPELLTGHPASVAADIYSAGVVLFYVLTRTYPVRAETLPDLHAAHQERTAPDVRELRPEVPRALALAIARALSPAPQRRQPTAKALASELAAIYGGLLTLAIGVGLALGWPGAPADEAAPAGPEGETDER